MPDDVGRAYPMSQGRLNQFHCITHSLASGLPKLPTIGGPTIMVVP